MSMWQVGDIAVAVRSAECACGGHQIEHRKTYRVQEILCEDDSGDADVYLDVNPAPDCHFYPHYYFRREAKADKDIFKLADAPVPKDKVSKPVLEPVQ